MPRTTATKSKSLTPGIAEELEDRLMAHAASQWPTCHGVFVRVRGQFAYVDVLAEGEPEPEPLFRLRYTGDPDTWEFAYFTWSRETYEPSFLMTGLPFGTPEDCFDTAAMPLLG